MSQDLAATGRLRLAVAQLNPVVGDVAGNLALVRKARARAAEEGADLVLFSELFLSGYPPEDLVLKPAFVAACKAALEELAGETADGGPGLIVGLPWREGELLHNAVALIDGGRVVGVRFKVDLPNYGEFDEKRVFQPGPLPGPLGFRGIRLGVPVCEDAWGEEVCECLAETGAELLLVPNGSPFHTGKAERRLQVMVARVVETDLPLVYCNQIGGQDELVFDGASFALQADRSLAFQMGEFVEEIAITEWRRDGETWICENGPRVPLPDADAANWQACVLGFRDYVEKNRFPGVVLGLSGGIDSAVVAAMAVDALGAERVHCIMLPYRYTSTESLADAQACVDAMGLRYDVVPIAPAVEGFSEALSGLFAGTEAGVTEENLQSRARGTILMAVSNKFGAMVATTGNKSEMSVGYATLYGDMNGGFNPIKDLYKTEVYRLAAWRNANRPEGLKGPAGIVIPQNIITKVPTAELRENQTDQDSLPPYEVLDDILECLVENEMSVGEIEARGHDRALIHRIEHLLYIAEYKRRQSAPGVKITRKNFGRDRRYPITNRYRDRS
ncbi:NAD+ synthase [Stappia sp.]|uniref:NAD+ synthase n=1 Tax=Stappia sp. TaxID=1870903 RepID=UPI003A9A2A0F